MTAPRFRVLTVTGYRTTTGHDHPGVSATVYDSLTGRELVTYRSEPRRRRNACITTAEEYAAFLNADKSLPRCPRGHALVGIVKRARGSGCRVCDTELRRAKR